MISRYSNGSDFPQPIRKISPANTDVLHPFKMGERIDNLSEKYFGDPTCGWIIMCANPKYENELEIPIGTDIRIPLPLNRVLTLWGITQDI